MDAGNTEKQHVLKIEWIGDGIVVSLRKVRSSNCQSNLESETHKDAQSVSQKSTVSNPYAPCMAYLPTFG